MSLLWMRVTSIYAENINVEMIKIIKMKTKTAQTPKQKNEERRDEIKLSRRKNG